MNVLGTAPARTTWTEAVGFWRPRRVARETPFEDWTIDGVPLRELAAAGRGSPGPAQEITALDESRPTGAVAALRRLLGVEPGDFGDGRVSLLVCPLCADLGCRALSASVGFEGDRVGWNDVGWQVDYEPFLPADDLPAPAPEWRFERAAYTGLLRGLLDRFERLATPPRG